MEAPAAVGERALVFVGFMGAGKTTAAREAAAALGAADRLGTLEPGKLADVVACDGNPALNIPDLRRTRFVMKGGAVIRLDDRHP